MKANVQAQQPPAWPDNYYSRMSEARSISGSAHSVSIRNKAFLKFKTTGFPARRSEEWKYTNAARYFESEYLYPETDVKAGGMPVGTFLPAGDSHTVVFLNGRLLPGSSETGSPLPGLRIRALSQVFSSEGDPDSFMVLKHLGSALAGHETPLELLNLGLFLDGAVVIIEPDAVLEKPVQLLFLYAGDSQPIAVNSRILILAGRNSRADIVEVHSGEKLGGAFTSTVVQTVLEDGARLNHQKVITMPEEGFHFGYNRVDLNADSSYNSFNYVSGGGMVRNQISSTLKGRRAECRLHGLALLDRNQHADCTIEMEHLVPDCISDQVFRGIFTDKSTGVLNGTISVAQGAQKTDARQSNRSILLSDSASSFTRPHLVIRADDVSCTHGAAIGELDDEILFYLRSRGISETFAREIVLTGFAGELLEKLENGQIRSVLEGLLSRRVKEIVNTEKE